MSKATCKICGRPYGDKLVNGLCIVCLTSALASSKVGRVADTLTDLAPSLQTALTELRGDHWDEATLSIDKAIAVLEEATKQLQGAKAVLVSEGADPFEAKGAGDHYQ